MLQTSHDFQGGGSMSHLLLAGTWRAHSSLADWIAHWYCAAAVRAGIWRQFLVEQVRQLGSTWINCLTVLFLKLELSLNHCFFVSVVLGGYEEEERRRNVIGLSARSKCLALLEIVDCLGTDTSQAFKEIAEKLSSDWNQETVKRYVTVAKKLNASPLLMEALMQLEFIHGRDSGLDGITALRSLVSLNLEDKDSAFIVTLPQQVESPKSQTVLLTIFVWSFLFGQFPHQANYVLPCLAQATMINQEQRCGFRKGGSVIPLRHAKGNFDIGMRLKAILIRRDVFQHLIGMFTKFQDDIKAYMQPSWYDQFVDQPEQEAEGTNQLGDDDGDDLRPEVSSFASKAPLTRLCVKLAKGHYELSLCKIASLVLKSSLNALSKVSWTLCLKLPQWGKRAFLQSPWTSQKMMDCKKWWRPAGRGMCHLVAYRSLMLYHNLPNFTFLTLIAFSGIFSLSHCVYGFSTEDWFSSSTCCCRKAGECSPWIFGSDDSKWHFHWSRILGGIEQVQSTGEPAWNPGDQWVPRNWIIIVT